VIPYRKIVPWVTDQHKYDRYFNGDIKISITGSEKNRKDDRSDSKNQIKAII